MTYWEKRQQQLNKQMEKDEAALKKRLSSYFDTEFVRLDREIAAYYQRYGVENVIQYRTLMETLSEADRRLLMEEMDKFAARYPEYAHLMPVRESIYRLNRLEGLQYSVRMQQLEIGAVENEEITAYLNKQAERGVNAAAEALGFGKNFYANNPDISKLFVNTAWSNGQNFSQRIWGNTSKLAEYLNTDIAQGIARGDSYDRLVRQLRARFGKVSRNDAYRLIYTEGTYVMAESSMQPFLEDFEQYRLSTVGDGKVCEICREVAKHVFDIKDRKPGTNFPPLHPWCRCTFTIEVADWDKWMEDYERRHGNGQAQTIEKRLNNADKNGTIKAGNATNNFDRKARIFTVDEDLKATNPNYVSGEYKWRNNCQRCVSAYEMRRRGYSVTAKPLPGRLSDDYLAAYFENAWENAQRIWCHKGSGKIEIEDYMSRWGNGTRAVIGVRWKGGGGHVFVAENIEGKIHYYDPQSGSNDCSSYFRDAFGKGTTHITRVDNLTPSEHIEDCCENVR